MSDEHERHQSDQGRRNDKSSKLGYIVFFSLSAIVLQLLLLDPQGLNQMVHNEVKASYEALGKNKWVALTGKTSEQFDFIIVDSGFKEYYLDAVTRETNDTFPLAKVVGKLMPFVHRFANNIQVITYQLLHRANLLVAWAYVLIPFIIAQLAAGVYQWRIRAYTFGNKTKARMLIIRKILRIIYLVMLAFFFLPSFYPLLSAYLPVIALTVSAYLMQRYIMTVQKFW